MADTTGSKRPPLAPLEGAPKRPATEAPSCPNGELDQSADAEEDVPPSGSANADPSMKIEACVSMPMMSFNVPLFDTYKSITKMWEAVPTAFMKLVRHRWRPCFSTSVISKPDCSVLLVD